MPAFQPYGENPPYGMIGRIEETSASFEARSAPRSHPTKGDIADLLLLQRKSKGCNLEIRLCCQLAVLKLVFRIKRGN